MSENFKKYLQEQGYSSTTIQSHINNLKRLHGWAMQEGLEPEQLSYTELLSYTKHCQNGGASKETVNHYLITIRHYFNHLIEQEQAIENPAQYLQLKGTLRKRLYDIFTPVELESIYHRYCIGDFSSKRYSTLKLRHEREHLRNKVIVGMLIYQGLRSDEIIHLRLEDIKLRQGMLEVPEVKNSNSRELKLESCQIMDLHQYITAGRKEITDRVSDQLFVSTGSKLYNTLNKIAQQLQIIESRVKSLQHIRASVITKWLKLYNLRQVQYLAGHKWISSTEEYLPNVMEGLSEEINKYHPLG
jgi:site-specific recombinase XerD